jgi:hypothetical protein
MQVINAPCRMVGDTREHIGKPCLPIDIAQSWLLAWCFSTLPAFGR